MSDDSDSLALDFERVSLLYANTEIGYLGAGVAVLTYGFLIQELSSLNIALFWMLAVFLAYIPRITISILFSRKITNREITRNNIKPWERYFFLNSILPFAIFSTAIFIPYDDNSSIAILFYSAMVMTLVAGGTLTYSTSLPAIKLYMNITMLPLIAKCFWMQDILFSALGISLLFAYLLISKLTYQQHNLLFQNITLRIENEHRSLTDPLTKLWNRRRLGLFIETLIPS